MLRMRPYALFFVFVEAKLTYEVIPVLPLLVVFLSDFYVSHLADLENN